jgi:radical SAM superfamily enzyme YgiQ (UPF0313 family)
VLDQVDTACHRRRTRDRLQVRLPRPPILLVRRNSATPATIRGGLSAARIIREAVPDVPIVWGGVHPTLVPDSTLRHPLVDAIATGEGEETVVELARCLSGRGDPRQVPGLVLKREGRPERTPPRGRSSATWTVCRASATIS